MRRRSLRWRLFPPVLIGISVLVGWGCGVLNPDLLGATGTNLAASVTGTEGNVVIMVVNDTSGDAQADVTVTKENGAQLVLNVPAAANNHSIVVQNCEVQTIQVNQALVVGANGGVVVPTNVAPVTMGLNLQCGGGVVISISGTPPGVFVNAWSF